MVLRSGVCGLRAGHAVVAGHARLPGASTIRSVEPEDLHDGLGDMIGTKSTWQGG